MIRPEDIHPSTPLGAVVLRELARLGAMAPVDVDLPHSYRMSRACELCPAAAEPPPPADPARSVLRARRLHRPTVAVDVVARRGNRPDARAEGGAR